MKNFFKNYTSIFLLLLSTLRAQVEDCSTVDDASRIIIAGGSITEIIYFIGVEDKIIGLDVTSVYPEQTKDFPSIGYVRNLSAEAKNTWPSTTYVLDRPSGLAVDVKQKI